MTVSNGPLYALGGAHPHALARNDAMRGLATGNREGKAAEREQVVYTPWSIIEVCLATWNRIDLDPCSGPDSIVPATRALRFDLDIAQNGLILPWEGNAYFNPTYKNLDEWLDKSAFEQSNGEQIGLFPVRPNRVWWCKYMSEVPSVIAWLKPLKFEGYDSGFPAPLVLIYTGTNTDAFREAVRPLSTYVGGPLR